MRGVARVERERVEVRVLIPAEVLPRRSAVVRAEDPTRSDAVVELAGSEDDVRIVGIDLDHVVVEALPTAVVLDGVGARARGCDHPARARIRRFEDTRRVTPCGVGPVEAGVEDGRLEPAGVRDRDRKPRLATGVIRDREPVHDRRPCRTAVGALVDRVAPERRVDDLRVLRIDLNISRAVELGLRFFQQRPAHGAVRRFPDAEPRMHGRRGPARTATTTEDARVEVVRVRGVDDKVRDGDRFEEVARYVAPVGAAVRRLQDAVTEVAVAGKSAFPRSGVDDRVVRGRDRERAGRQ